MAPYFSQIAAAALVFPLAAAFLVLPGIVPASVVAAELELPSAAVPPVAFGVTMGLIGLAGEVAYLAGWGLAAAAVLSAVLVLAALAWTVSRWGWIRPSFAWPPWVLGVGVAAASLLQGSWRTGDAPYHLAAVRSLLTFGRPLVTDPFYGMSHAPLDTTSGSWHTALAMLSATSRLDPLALWPVVTALAAGLTGMAFWALAEGVTGSRAGAAVATVAFMLAQFLGDFRAFGYPGFASRAVLLVAVLAAVRCLTFPRPVALATTALLGFSAAAMHVGTAEAFFAAAGLVALVAGVGARVGRECDATASRGLLVLLLALAVAALAAAPLLVQRLAAMGSLTVDARAFQISRTYVQVLPGVLFPLPAYFLGRATLAAAVSAVTLGVLAVAVLALIARRAVRTRDARDWGLVGIVALPLALEMPPASLALLGAGAWYMLVRLAEVAHYATFIGIAWALSARAGRAAHALGAAALAIALIAAAPGVVSVYSDALPGRIASAPTVAAMWRTAKPGVWAPALPKLRELTEDGSRVAADPATGYHLLALVPITLVAVQSSHSPFFVENTDGAARREAVKTLLAADTTRWERERIARQYDVGLLVVSPATPSYQRVLASLRAPGSGFRSVLATGGLWAFQPSSAPGRAGQF